MAIGTDILTLIIKIRFKKNKKILKKLLHFKNRKSIIAKVVTMTMRIHLFPYRTQKLSSLMPKILVGYPAGKIGSRQLYIPQ